MNTTMDAAREAGKPPVETETVGAELFLQRRLGEDEPRAWALAWCEAGLVPRRRAGARFEMTSAVGLQVAP